MPSPAPGTSIERNGRQAIVHVRGDVVVATARKLHATLRALQRRRDVRDVIVDFTDAGRLDSAGVAVIQLAKKSFGRRRTLKLTGLDERKQTAFELAPAATKQRKEPGAATFFEGVGDKVLETGASMRQLLRLVGDTLHQSGK